MKCPKDNETLSHVSVTVSTQGDMRLDICKKCQGVWVDKDELLPLVSNFRVDEQRTYKNWLTATSDGKTAPKDFWSEGERMCPKDGIHMKKHYTGIAHLVGIEQCPTCAGFWFDGSELHALAKNNEPNPTLDRAIGGSLAGIRSELQDNYDPKKVFWWDLPNRPEIALPYIRDLLLNLMVAFLVNR